MKTRVTELFGIDLPIIGGGMVWLSTAKLAAAVSEAGGIGLLAGGSNSGATLAEQIDRTRELTDKPFGVNIPIQWPPSAEIVDVVIEKDVKVVFTSAGSPKRFTSILKEAGITVVHVVPSSLLAKKCEDAGVDAVVAEGSEGGGHLAMDEVNTMVLVPLCREAISIPLIAAGGIGTGAQMTAAFALGAEAVQIGTRFIAAKECEGHENFKNAVVNAGENDTVVSGRSIGPLRNIKNQLTAEIQKMEMEGKSANEILNYVGFGRASKASLEGDVEWGTVQAGQVAGLIREILPVKTIIDRIMKEAKATATNLGTVF